MIAASPSTEPTTAPAIAPGAMPLEVFDELAAPAAADDALLEDDDDEVAFELELDLATDEDEGAGHPRVGKLLAKPSIGCA